MKLQSALLQINFLQITQFCHIYSLKPLQNTSCSPVFQTFKLCIRWSCYFKMWYPAVPLQYTLRAEMWHLKTQLHCSYYKWQLHVSATQQPSSGCLCENYKMKFYSCSLHVVKNDLLKKISHLTYSGIRLLHGKKCSQYKSSCKNFIK